MNYLAQHQSKGEIPTGLLYVEPDPEDLHAHLNTVDAPVAGRCTWLDISTQAWIATPCSRDVRSKHSRKNLRSSVPPKIGARSLPRWMTRKGRSGT